MKSRIVLLLAAGAAATAALWPAAAGAASGRGVVVAREHGTLLVAMPSGLVRAVRGRAAVGSRVAFGAHVTVFGHARTALIHGIVVRRLGTTLFLSSNRHLLAIHTGRRLADVAPTPSTATLAPGTVVTAEVSVGDDGLDEESETEDGHVSEGSISVQASVSAVGTGTVTLDVQGRTLTVPLPVGLALPAALVGQTVTIQLSLDEQADDQGDDQGGDGD
jgi:hypothetical protein